MREVTMEARIDNLPRMFDVLINELRKYGVDASIIKQCKLCAEEVFMNISCYAYKPGTGDVTMKIDTKTEEHKLDLRMIFSDSGKPFNPLLTGRPDLDSDLEHRKIGGLGIYLVKSTMDSVQYDRIDSRNILTLKKILDI